METSEASTLPQVSVRQGRTGVIVFVSALAALAIVLFVGLESARMAREPVSEIPSASAEGDLALRSNPATDLYIPAAPTAVTGSPISAPGTITQPLFPPPTYVAPPPAASRSVLTPRYESPVPPSTYTPQWVAPAPPDQLPTATGIAERSPQDAARITPQRIRNLSSTVVQGTLIRAVLETALDSTRAGQARALVSRDVRGFDGTRVLIPRGSQLFGEYGSDNAAGQNRLMIRWTRLLLPGGVSIALDSPVADPLGRAGVRARVDSHLMTRLGNALVDSSASVASTLLGRRAGSGNQVVVALPGAVQAGTATTPRQVTPTLKVAQGERISVFVAHDLDFADENQ